FPIKYGYAAVGRVIEGPGIGQLVFSLHPHQTEFIVPVTSVVPLPEGMEERGVFLANMETAVNVVLDAAPRLGENVVVFGQGVVGLLITQLLKRTGVSHVAAGDPIERRRELALSVGAESAIEVAAGHDYDSGSGS